MQVSKSVRTSVDTVSSYPVSSQPLRELLSTKQSWVWGSSQEQALAQIKVELTQPTVLMLYDPQAPNKVSADEVIQSDNSPKYASQDFYTLCQVVRIPTPDQQPSLPRK